VTSRQIKAFLCPMITPCTYLVIKPKGLPGLSGVSTVTGRSLPWISIPYPGIGNEQVLFIKLPSDDPGGGGQSSPKDVFEFE
jgi:hypothetical protein